MTDTTKFKSIALETEAYDLLKLWADREVRSVSGHVKWLILKYLPKDLLRTSQATQVPGTIIEDEDFAAVRTQIEAAKTFLTESTLCDTPAKVQHTHTGKSYKVGEEGYERAQGVSKYKRRGLHPRSTIMDFLKIIQAYGEPVTNFELMELAPDREDSDFIAKRTSAAYYSGVLERKNITGTGRKGRFIYRITPRGEKLLKSVNRRESQKPVASPLVTY
jgi:hypothetical protein